MCDKGYMEISQLNSTDKMSSRHVIFTFFEEDLLSNDTVF